LGNCELPTLLLPFDHAPRGPPNNPLPYYLDFPGI
jgi:hypothetical protein